MTKQKEKEPWFCGWGHIHKSETAAAKCKAKIEGGMLKHTRDLQTARKKKK